MKLDNGTSIDREHPNRLIDETSPYLLQHAYNPVDWHPWDEEALATARREDKPIFLSIGYAACHWCHVMEKESFEDREIASMLNDNFVSIKVDREQRPDLDQIYMTATQALTGGGGWPMSVFLTPELRPFYAGTYFPPTDRYGHPGFKSVLSEIIRVYKNERDRVDDLAGNITARLEAFYRNMAKPLGISRSDINDAAAALLDNFDTHFGGFGGTPKFPHHVEISFLFKASRGKDGDELEAALKSLDMMARGGIYDHLGGGFHRYSVDERWLVPHFEKMLYDNALLAVCYAEAFQITGKRAYLDVVEETLDFILREMTDRAGGFYSSLDADSEGEEGKYYVWKKEEIDRLLGNESELFCRYFNVTEQGNFEGGTNILNIDGDSDRYRISTGYAPTEFDTIVKKLRQKLFRARRDRTRPDADDKVLVSWTSLAITAFVRGYQVAGLPSYRQAAVRAADFITDRLYRDGILKHTFRDGKVNDGPFLEDYAYFVQGLIDLYEIEHDFGRIELALELARKSIEYFTDEEMNFYLAGENRREQYIRPREINDGSLPAPGSIMMQSLLRLADITGKSDLREYAERALQAVSRSLKQMPQGMISAVTAAGHLFSENVEVVVIGEEGTEDFLREIFRRYMPYRTIVVTKDGREPVHLLENRPVQKQAIAYVCRNQKCNNPARDPEMLKKQLSGL